MLTNSLYSSIEATIYSIISEIKEFRNELIKIIVLLKNVEAFREILISIGSQAEKLIKVVEETSD